jgi:hypothetical protein
MNQNYNDDDEPNISGAELAARLVIWFVFLLAVCVSAAYF